MITSVITIIKETIKPIKEDIKAEIKEDTLDNADKTKESKIKLEIKGINLMVIEVSRDINNSNSKSDLTPSSNTEEVKTKIRTKIRIRIDKE